MLIIPAVDVLNARVVRLVRGDFGEVTEYGSDPVAAVRRWAAAGARLVHVVDLDGARRGRPDPRLWRRLGLAGPAFQAGGGFRTFEHVEEALQAGAGRVVLGTAALDGSGLVARVVDAYGPDRVAAAIDVRDGRVAGRGWLEDAGSLREALRTVRSAGVEWLVVTSIERDGTLAGPDVELLRSVVAALPGRQVLAAGGVATLDDLAALAPVGVAGAIIGRALYDGTLDAAEALAAFG